MPMRHGGSWATKGSTFCRASRFFTITCPWVSMPWTHTPFLAISTPSVVTCAMVDPPAVDDGCRSHHHRDLSQVTCTVGGSIPLRSHPNSAKSPARLVVCRCRCVYWKGWKYQSQESDPAADRWRGRPAGLQSGAHVECNSRNPVRPRAPDQRD